MSLISLNFQNVKFKNFLSFGKQWTNFEIKEGINFISGFNVHTKRANGAGKSNLIESLVFGSYGKTLKDLNQNEILNWKNGKKCEVNEVFYKKDDKYEIKRGLKPNSLVLYKNDEEVNPPSDKRDYQKYIEDVILGMDYKTFTSLIHTNTNSLVSIFKAPKPQKRALLENLFNLYYFSNLSKNANEKLKNTKEKNQENKLNQNNLKLNNDKYLEQNKSYQNDIDSIIIDQSILKKLENSLKEARDEIQDLNIEEKQEQLKKFNNKSEKLKKILKILDSKIFKYKAIKEALNIEDIEYDEEIHKKIIKKLENSNKEKLEEILDKIEKKNEYFFERKSEIKANIQSIINEIKRLEKRFDIDGYSECDKCGSKINSKQIIEETKEKIDKLEEEKRNNNFKQERFNAAHLKIKNIKDTYNDEIKKYDKFIQKEEKLKEQKDKYKQNEKKKTKEIHYDYVLDKLKNKKEKIKQENQKYIDQINTLETKIKSQEVLINKPQEIEKEIQTEKEKIQLQLNQRKKLFTYIENNKQIIEENNEKIKKINKNLKKNNSIIDYCNYVNYLCKDENAKQYAISNITPYLNSRTNYYLSESEIGFYIKLDSWLNPTIKGNGVTNGSYDNLSGGEQKTLELAIQFAFLDIAKINAQINPNLLLLDEVLDSSIDEIGIKNIMKLIETKQKEDNLAVYIISHRKEFSDYYAHKNYLVKKENGYSKLEEMEN